MGILGADVNGYGMKIDIFQRVETSTTQEEVYAHSRNVSTAYC
jgi:hypothetical protein